MFIIFTRSSSVVCNVPSCHLGPDITLSLPGLACPGWRYRPGMVAPVSPFPLLTGLGFLLETITGIHKGLSCKVAFTEDFKWFWGVLHTKDSCIFHLFITNIKYKIICSFALLLLKSFLQLYKDSKMYFAATLWRHTNNLHYFNKRILFILSVFTFSSLASCCQSL